MQVEEAEPGEPFFSDPRYRGLPFDEKRFRPLEASGGRVACVDGGNACLLDTPSMAVHLVRAYYNVFNADKRVKQEKAEFLVVARARKGGRALEAECRELNGFCLNGFELNAFDETVSLNGRKALPSAIGNVARRYAEWALTEKALKEADAVVRDGALETSVSGEADYARKCFGSGKLCGVAKTCSLLTTTNLPLTAAVQRMAPDGAWVYGPACENGHPDHNAEIFVARFHSGSGYAFRFEVEKGGREGIAEKVAFQCSDSCFPGYPYGLVDADKMARVSFRETAAARQLLGLKNAELLRATDAHSVLDVI